MISAAITAGIAAVLSFFGIPPGPYVAGVYIGVKVTMVSVIALLGWRTVKKKRARELAEAQRAQLEAPQPPKP